VVGDAPLAERLEQRLTVSVGCVGARHGAGWHAEPPTERHTGMVDVRHLFVYGTLLPGEPRWQFLEPYVDDEGRLDGAAGTLFDTGLGYPAARFGTADVILGRVFSLRRATLDEALVVLDELEGSVEGVYRRITISTHAHTPAYAYEYGGGLDLRPISSGSWLDRV
jgi:gamma-glutamylcyclotransferase (GGCT)/AIG2-like uncharacterized protein YtfP